VLEIGRDFVGSPYSGSPDLLKKLPNELVMREMNEKLNWKIGQPMDLGLIAERMKSA
jgi:hypothetical protein